MNQCLDGLKQTVKSMNQLYVNTGASNQRPRSDSPTMFLSQLPLQQYYKDEEDYSTQLTAYTKKQFFQVFNRRQLTDNCFCSICCMSN